MKQRSFEAVVDQVTRRVGLDAQYLLMSIVETAAENWWAYGRTVDPSTGFGTHTTPQT